MFKDRVAAYLNKCRRALPAALVVLTFLLPIRAQELITLNGRVVDRQGAGIPRATVILYARSRPTERYATITDDSGTYRFERISPGEYVLSAEAEGFAHSAAQGVSVTQGGQPLNVTLEVAGVREEVVVTASGTVQTVDEVSKAITVVDQREIQERDEVTVADALRTVPGLRVQQLGGPGTLTSIKARGLRSQDTAVLIDGVRLRDASTITGDASSLLSDLLVTNLSRVEVLRGSGSSLYGTNAIGGVINVVTDEGGGPFHGSLEAEGGGLGLFRGRAQFAGGSGANRVIYSAGVSHLNVTRGVDGNDATRATNGQGRLLFRLTPTTTFSTRLYASDSFLQLNESPQAVGTLPASGIVNAVPLSSSELRRFEAGTPISALNANGATFIPSADDPDDRQAVRFLSGSAVFTQRPTEGFGYSLSYHGLVTRRTVIEGPAGVGFEPFGGSVSNKFDGSIHTLQGRTDFQLGKFNLVTAGYEFETEDFNNISIAVSPSDNSSVDVSQHSHTFFVQDQLRLLDDRLQLSAGFRAQTFSLSQPHFNPSANSPYSGVTLVSPSNAYTGDGSIAYTFRSTGTKLRAHVGNGYRAPSLYERFGTFFSGFTGTFSALGDPTLRSERSIAFDTGVDQTFANNRLRASATYFYTRLQEVIGFGPVTTFNRIFGGYLNTGGGLARGAELSLSAAPTRTLDLFTSYTYTNSDERTPRVGNVLRAFVIPDHQFSLVATQRFGDRIAVNFDLVATSNYLAPIFDNRSFDSRVYRFKGIIKADLVAGYTWPLADRRRLRIFGKVENLFDRQNFESGFRTPGRIGAGGVSLSF